MITNNLSALKIHKLSQAQYDRELAAGNIDETALYLTPDEGGSVSEDLINEKIAEAKLAMYPVGSIYISTTDTNPSTFLGGTWELFGQGKTLIGVDANDTDFNSAEKTGGAKTHTLTSNELPGHTHSIPALSGTAADATHSHSASFTSGNNSVGHTHSISITSGTVSANHTHSISLTSGTQSANHTHAQSGTFTTSSNNHRHVVPHNVASFSGSGTAYGHMYNSAGETNASYKNRYTGYNEHTHTVAISGNTGNNSANHTHSVSGNTGTISANHSHTVSGTSGGISANHTHSTTVTFNNGGSHSHTVSTTASTSGSTGGGSAHNNLQPYITVYMWKRVELG